MEKNPHPLGPLGPKDSQALVAHYMKLPAYDLARRYGDESLCTDDASQRQQNVNRVIAQQPGVLHGIYDLHGKELLTVCCLTTRGDNPAVAELAMSIAPAARNSGQAQDVLQWALRQAAQKKIEWVTMTVGESEAVRTALDALCIPHVVEHGSGEASVEVAVGLPQDEALAGELGAVVEAAGGVVASRAEQASIASASASKRAGA